MSGRRRVSSRDDIKSKAKKLRLSSAALDGMQGEFVRGSVVRISMEHFVTYDSCTFCPGPNLNVVLGPNGTGKSSLVCALCLGLAGSTSLLGRAKEVGEYVKHGYNAASIEIELSEPSGNITVKRVIYREGNLSKWQVNGQDVSQKQVVETVKRLNIQVGNRCQFLPQDMVVEFAKMTPSELLMATEKALECEELSEKHGKLVEIQEKEKGLTGHLESEEQHLERLNHQQDLDKPEYDRFFQRKKHMDRLKMLEKKRPWVEYENSRKEYKKYMEEKKEMKAVVDKLKEENEPLERKVKEAKDEAKIVENEAKNIVKKSNKNMAEAREMQDKMTTLESDLEEPKSNYESKVAIETKRLKKIDRWKTEIVSLEESLEKVSPIEDINEQLETVVSDLRKVSGDLNRIMTERERIRNDEDSVKRQLDNCKRQIQRLEDTRNQREEELRKSSQHTYDALQWLRANQDRFKELVIEPIMLVMKVKDSAKAKFVEAAIPFRDMTSFVCQNTEDLHLFLRETREKQGLKINAVQPPAEGLSHFKPKKQLCDLKRFGFQSYLINLIEAPNAVLRYLCKTCYIHDVPLGNEQTDMNISDVADKSGLVRFFTPTSSCSVKVSKYGSRDKSTRISRVRMARFLNVQMDIERHRDLQQQCQELRQESQRHSNSDRKLKVDEEGLRKQESELRQHKKDLSAKKGLKKKVENDIQTRRKRIDESNAQDAIDLEREERHMRQLMREMNEKRVQLAGTLQGIMEDCRDVVLKRIQLSFRHAQLASKCEKLQAAQRDATTALTEAELKYQQSREQATASKEKAKQLLIKAQEKTDTKKGTDLSDQLKQAFEQYPGTLDEIDALIHEERARAECNQATNAEIVRKYEERKNEIENLAAQIEEMQNQLEADKHGLEELKKSWLDPLNELLDKLSSQYSSFFQHMGCASEVSLVTNEDFSKYGIELKVKYRKNEELKVLTARHQSGGERSVATILYLMALQGVTNCPFRVVDEINQGMDPNNERRVFELVVDTVSSLGTSQYFLFSPKLLPDLPFNEHITVSVVYNGPYMLPHRSWDVEKAMRARQDISEEANSEDY